MLDVNTSVIGSGSATSFNALTGQTVTIMRGTSGKKTTVVTHPVWLFGTDDYMTVADNDLIDFGATDSFSVVLILRSWATTPSFARFLSKRNSSSAGYYVYNNSTLAGRASFDIYDGTNTASTASTAGTYTLGTLTTVVANRNVSADTIALFNNTVATGTATTDTTTGSLANTGPLRIGSTDLGANYADMEFVAAAIFRNALTTDQISTITNYYTARVG